MRAPGLDQALAADLVEEFARIDRHAVDMDFKMHVRSGGTAGGTGLGQLLPGADDVADAHDQLGIVPVQGAVAVAVVDFHDVAKATLDHGEVAAAEWWTVPDTQARIAHDPTNVTTPWFDMVLRLALSARVALL